MTYQLLRIATILRVSVKNWSNPKFVLPTWREGGGALVVGAHKVGRGERPVQCLGLHGLAQPDRLCVLQ